MKLNPAEIRALLDRYEAAETSLEEERQLKAALAESDLDASLLPYRQWFGGLEALRHASVPTQAGPWSQSPAASGAAFAKTPATAAVSGTSPLRVVHRASTRQVWSRIAVAAMLLVVCGAALLFWRKPQTPEAPLAAIDGAAVPIDWSKYEVTNPEEASRITRAALVQVSQHLHRGGELTAEELGRMEPIHLILNRKS